MGSPSLLEDAAERYADYGRLKSESLTNEEKLEARVEELENRLKECDKRIARARAIELRNEELEACESKFNQRLQKENRLLKQEKNQLILDMNRIRKVNKECQGLRHANKNLSYELHIQREKFDTFYAKYLKEQKEWFIQGLEEYGDPDSFVDN